jgi:hypothetical protein
MRLSIGLVVAGGALCLLSASPLRAEPTKAPKVSGALVTAYQECSTTNTFHAGGLQACSTPVRSDPLCDFGPRGSGSFQVAVRRRGRSIDIVASARLKGLNAGCEGKELRLFPFMRLTGDGCPEGARCTGRDVFVPVATCMVSGGKCKMSDTVNAELTGAVVPGRNIVYELLSVDIRRSDNSSRPAFRSGLLVQ